MPLRALVGDQGSQHRGAISRQMEPISHHTPAPSVDLIESPLPTCPEHNVLSGDDHYHQLAWPSLASPFFSSLHLVARGFERPTFCAHRCLSRKNAAQLRNCTKGSLCKTMDTSTRASSKRSAGGGHAGGRPACRRSIVSLAFELRFTLQATHQNKCNAALANGGQNRCLFSQRTITPDI